MTVLARGTGLVMGLLALGLAHPAAAQENLDQGKTPAQLYASDCAICHKSPQGLAARGGGLFGLEAFLREHYTASRETAAAIAGYLRAVGNPPATGRAARGKKGEGKAKGAEKKPGGKTGETKAGEPKASESKPADVKAAEPKAAEPEASESKASESKPADAKPAEPKPAEGSKSD